jgi:L-serine dehydratase
MHSIKEIYRIGHGPSSSHTMGPQRAAEIFKQQHPAKAYRVDLYGSLAATGKGHLTDQAIKQALEPAEVEFTWKPDELLPLHPNGLEFNTFDDAGTVVDTWRVYSVGGGAIMTENDPPETDPVYRETTMCDILRICTQSGRTFWEYVEEHEGSAIWDYLQDVLKVMDNAIERGIHSEGVLPGGLGLARRAWTYYRRIQLKGGLLIKEGYLPAYALAVSEENASGGKVVTAPTCGSAGVMPAVLRHIRDTVKTEENTVLRALASAGLIGNLIKQNASISGAEVGCQGEIGSACAMAAAAAAQLMGGSIRQVEYAAEMGLEHHLGLTCDPVDGMVQIPCIERNVFAATRALDCAEFACNSDGAHRVSFDDVVTVMMHTGHDLPNLYRETAEGGLATAYRFPPGHGGGKAS